MNTGIGALTRKVRRTMCRKLGIPMLLAGPTESNATKRDRAKEKRKRKMAAQSRRRNRS